MHPALLALALAAAAEPALPAPAGLALTATPAAPLPASLLAAAGLLAGLAAVALLAARRRDRPRRLLEVVETTSIGPRRALVVARMGGELLVLGASEAGIALLTTSPAVLAVPAPTPAPARPGPSGLLARLRMRPQRAPAPEFASLLAESVEDLELRRKLAGGRAGSVR